MEKRNSESQQFFTRSGKYSDRISRRGYMPGMNMVIGAPPITEQIDNLDAEIEKVLKDLEDIKSRLKETMPYPKWVQLDAEKKELGAKHQDLLRMRGRLTQKIRDIKGQEFARAFVEVAASRLSREAFGIISDEAHELMRSKDDPKGQ
jgi:hypothetical protein